MRKTTVIAAAALSAVLALAALAGCNENEKKARRYVENAKEKYRAVAQQNLRLEEQYKELQEIGESIQDVTPETITTMRKGLEDMLEIIEAQDSSSRAVRSEYRKVLDLDDAERYKKFVRLEIEKLSLVNRRADLLNALAAVAVKAMDSYTAGQPIDQAAVQNETNPLMKDLSEINSRIKELNEEAADLAVELNL